MGRTVGIEAGLTAQGPDFVSDNGASHSVSQLEIVNEKPIYRSESSFGWLAQFEITDSEISKRKEPNTNLAPRAWIFECALGAFQKLLSDCKSSGGDLFTSHKPS